MDSITQIVLGAAAGDAVLGKKIGNRAMVWGAIAGTIPDLDVIGNLWMSEIDSLAFHRGISHSFFFAIIGAFIFGWVVHRIYQSEHHKAIGIAGWSALAIGIGSLYKRHNRADFERPTATLRDWQWLFLWGLVTHPILDTFTAYGTQLFAPFTDYRAAISNISVADPIYTLLFAIPLVAAAFYHKSKPVRRKLLYTGIVLSSLYMCFTLYTYTKMV